MFIVLNACLTFDALLLSCFGLGLFIFIISSMKNLTISFGGCFQADVDGNGTIDYIEFITATMHLSRMEREDHLYKAFEYF